MADQLPSTRGSPRLTNLPDVNRQDTMDTGDDDLASAVMNGGVDSLKFGCAKCHKSPGDDVVFAPILTKCLHLICAECFDDERRRTAHSKLECASCKVETDVRDTAVGNVTAVQISDTVPILERCDEGQCEYMHRAVFKCCNCSIKLCIHDAFSHIKTTSTRLHKLEKLPISNAEVRQAELQSKRCMEHWHRPNARLETFCRDCTTLICRECVGVVGKPGAHFGHNTVSTFKQSDETRERLELLLKKAVEGQEHRGQGTSADIDAAGAGESLEKLEADLGVRKKEVDEIENTLKSAVTDLVERLRQSIDQQYASKTAELNECQSDRAGLQQAQFRMSELTQNDDGVLMCAVGPAVAARVEALLDSMKLPALTLRAGLDDLYTHKYMTDIIVDFLKNWQATGANIDGAKCEVHQEVPNTPSQLQRKRASPDTTSITKKPKLTQLSAADLNVKQRSSEPSATQNVQSVSSVEQSEDDDDACVQSLIVTCGTCGLVCHRKCHWPAINLMMKPFKCRFCTPGEYAKKDLEKGRIMHDPQQHVPYTSIRNRELLITTVFMRWGTTLTAVTREKCEDFLKNHWSNANNIAWPTFINAINSVLCNEKLSPKITGRGQELRNDVNTASIYITSDKIAELRKFAKGEL